MDIGITQEQGRVAVTVFKLVGDLTEQEPLYSTSKTAYDAGTRNILLDMSKVKYISSAGLRAIHEIFMMLRGDEPEESDEAVRKGIAMGTYKSPHLKLFKPTKNAMKTISVSGYDMFLDIHKNYKEAINSF